MLLYAIFFIAIAYVADKANDRQSKIWNLESEIRRQDTELAQLKKANRNQWESLNKIHTWASCAMTAPEAQQAIDGFEQIQDEAKKHL